MPRTIVECLTPAVPCAECEERDCCRDERMVAQLRARVAELEADLADADEVRTRRCNELIRDSNDYARMMEQRVAAAESRASAAVEAHSALLSRIAGDGTLDAMERASAAEQRAAELESDLDTARKMQRWDADCASAAERRAKRMEGALDLVSDFTDHSYHCAQKASLSAACDCGLDEMWATVRAALAESGATTGDGAAWVDPIHIPGNCSCCGTNGCEWCEPRRER